MNQPLYRFGSAFYVQPFQDEAALLRQNPCWPDVSPLASAIVTSSYRRKLPARGRFQELATRAASLACKWDITVQRSA